MNKQYAARYEKMVQQITFNLLRMKSKMFLPIGLELNCMDIFFEDNDSFAIPDVTFAYYQPTNNSIHINIEHEFFAESTPDKLPAKLFFVLYHECMHKILMHSADLRGKNKLPELWNIACDYEVHNMFQFYFHQLNENDNEQSQIYAYMKWPSALLYGKVNDDNKFLYDKQYQENIAEEIYYMIHNSEEKTSQNFTFNMSGSGDSVEVPGKKTTYTLPDGTEVSSYSIKWPENNQLPEGMKKSNEKIQAEKNSLECSRALLENAIVQTIKECGNGSAECERFLKKLFHVKIDWEKVLRNSLRTMLDKSDYFAWSKLRTSTFLMPGMSYLPDIVEDETKYGTLIIARDESGSMTDDDISKAAAIITEAKEFYNKIVVIKHDHTISEVIEFEEFTPEILTNIATRKSCGGTAHAPVFEYIAEYVNNNRENRVSCFIGISDLYSDIETSQKILPANIPVIWLVPNMYKKTNNINGKIIPVE